jgi:hypothetical protein
MVGPTTATPKAPQQVDIGFVPAGPDGATVGKTGPTAPPPQGKLSAPDLPGNGATAPGGVASKTVELPAVSRGATDIDATTSKLQPSLNLSFLAKLFDWLLSLFGAGAKDKAVDQAKAFATQNPEYMAAARAEWNQFGHKATDTFEGDLASTLAAKLQQNSAKNGTTLSDDDALDMANAMVAAMVEAEKSPSAPKGSTAAAHTMADKLGEPFKSTLQTLEQKTKSSDKGEAAAAQDGIDQMLVIMIAQRDGLTKGIPPSLIRDMVNGLVNPQVGYDASFNLAFLNALVILPPSVRAELCDKLENVPEDRRLAVMHVMAGEARGLQVENPAIREKAWKRIDKACMQACKLPDAEFKQVSGVLGLDRAGDVKVKSGGQEISIPVYVHPGVSEADRKVAVALYTKALGNYPLPLIDKLSKGEDGVPFCVSIEPGRSIFLDGQNHAGMYDTHTNVIRLNASYMGSSAAGIDGVHDLTHEIGHAVDDMLKPGADDEMTQTKNTALLGHFAAARAGGNPGWLGAPTPYSGTNIHEYWAESMGFYANKEEREILKTRDPVMFSVCERFFALCSAGKVDEARQFIEFGSQPPAETAKRPLGDVADDVHAFVAGYALPQKMLDDQGVGKRLRGERAKEIDAFAQKLDDVIAAAKARVDGASGPEKKELQAGYERLLAERQQLKDIRAGLDKNP